MSPLEHLASLLRPAATDAARDMAVSPSMGRVFARMQERARESTKPSISKDQQLAAIRRFWDSQEVASFREAYLLSGGLFLPYRPNGPCLFEDRQRFRAVLDGVNRWCAGPSSLRRCYRGLITSYFTYDGLSETVPPAGKENWRSLRDYLRDKNGHIRSKQHNPDWVNTAIGNRQLFGENPCAPYVDALLRGDAGAIDHLCEELGISKASWFLRQLVLAQIQGVTRLGDGQFKALLPRMLALLANNNVLRDRGLVMLLDRYVKVLGLHLHQELRDSSVQWWGNPWLPSNETRWGGVVGDARTMVSDWLKLELIEAFFTKLAEDGMGDRRRMEFWKRYVKSINRIEFALGSTARSSRDPDLVILREKMRGLTRHLDAAGTNNAFIMTMGNLVAVEFSGMGNALYGYDAAQSLPFDTSAPLRLPQFERNSLKQKSQAILWISHQDGINGWDEWEQMFEATLRKSFGIEAGNAAPQGPHPSMPRESAAPATSTRTASHGGDPAIFEPYSRGALNRFTRRFGLEIDDKTSQGGSLWVRTGAEDAYTSKVLSRWSFNYKPDKGWWK